MRMDLWINLKSTDRNNMTHRYASTRSTVEAFQLTKDSCENREYWPTWFKAAWQEDKEGCVSLHPTLSDADIKCVTLIDDMGEYEIKWGEWLIYRSDDDPYGITICSDEVFRRVYMKVE